jgi:hypothetical protein
VVRHFCWEDPARTTYVYEILLDALCRASWNNCGVIFQMFEALLELSDELRVWRIITLLNHRADSNGVLDIMHHYRDRYPRFVQFCLLHVMKLAHLFPAVAAYLYQCRDQWSPWVRTFGFQRIAALQSRDNEIRSLVAEVMSLCEGKLELRSTRDTSYTEQTQFPEIVEAPEPFNIRKF